MSKYVASVPSEKLKQLSPEIVEELSMLASLADKLEKPAGNKPKN